MEIIIGIIGMVIIIGGIAFIKSRTGNENNHAEYVRISRRMER